MNEERLTRLDVFISEGRLVRKAWSGKGDDGRELACLLATLSPEAGVNKSAGACPADVMPQWLAQITPWIDDAGTEGHWLDVVRRYAKLAHRWHVLSEEDWRRLDFRVRALAVKEAMKHTTEEDVLDACRRAISLCDRAGLGEVVSVNEWALARGSAATLTRAATRAASRAASAAAEAVVQATREEASAAAGAVVQATRVATWASWASWATWASWASWATWASADRLIDAILDEMERTITEREGVL